jgi:hypothetical protein
MKFSFDGPDAVRREFSAAFEHEQRVKAALLDAGLDDVQVCLRRRPDGSWEFPLRGEPEKCRRAEQLLEATAAPAATTGDAAARPPSRTQVSETVTIKTDVKAGGNPGTPSESSRQTRG